MMIDVSGHVREVHSSMSTLFCYHLEHDVACYEAPAFGGVGDSGICEASCHASSFEFRFSPLYYAFHAVVVL